MTDEFEVEDAPDFIIEETGGVVPEPPPGLFTEFDHARPTAVRDRISTWSKEIRAGGTSPSARGWGTPSASYGPTHIVRVTGRGITLYVHREMAVIFGHLLVDLDNHLKTRSRSLVRRQDDWGYAHRKIAGSSTWSNHAWGLAVDFDAIDNPQGRTLVTEFSPGYIDRLLATKYKGLIRWGGRYGGTTKKDAMHFEFMGSVAQARSLTAALRAKPVPPSGHNHSMPTLSSGSTDPVVNDLQGHLNYAYRLHPDIVPLKIDGQFGERTLIRLRDWQQRTGIPITGKADRATWLRLHQVTKGIRWDFNRKAF